MSSILLGFFAYMIAAGVAVGLIVVRYPEAHGYALPPFFWVILLMAAFEIVAGYVLGRSPGALLTMPQRDRRLRARRSGLRLLIPYLAPQLIYFRRGAAASRSTPKQLVDERALFALTRRLAGDICAPWFDGTDPVGTAPGGRGPEGI